MKMTNALVSIVSMLFCVHLPACSVAGEAPEEDGAEQSSTSGEGTLEQIGETAQADSCTGPWAKIADTGTKDYPGEVILWLGCGRVHAEAYDERGYRIFVRVWNNKGSTSYDASGANGFGHANSNSIPYVYPSIGCAAQNSNGGGQICVSN